MTFRRVNDFSTEDPQKLDRELAQLEDNIAAEFDLARKQLAPQLQVVTFRPTSAQPITAILPDQQLSIDTSLANAAVVFPALTPANFGRRFVIIKRTGTGSIVTSCQDASVLCNGTTFPTLSFGGLPGVATFFCDAGGYYR